MFKNDLRVKLINLKNLLCCCAKIHEHKSKKSCFRGGKTYKMAKKG